MIKLIIFDFDGTLADTNRLIVETNQELARQMHYPVPTAEQITAVIGLPMAGCIHGLFPGVKEEEVPAWAAKCREIFYSLKSRYLPVLFPHVKETLAALQAKGYVLTVASSRSNQSLNEFLQEMGVSQYFSYVLGGDNVTHAKPNPEPVLKTLRELDYEADEALVVGDMSVDIRMGADAGAHTCGVSYGNSNRAELLAAGADSVIDDFAELL